jgi:hypothetical protein
VSCRCVSHLTSLIITRYRAFAELLERGTGSTLILPIHKPALPAPAPAPAPAPIGLNELDALSVLGLNPANALQHPGFYYYIAAQATERRRAKFLAILETMGTGEAVFHGFANERKVDHFGIIVEVRSHIRVLHSADGRAKHSYTPKRTSYSRSTCHCPTDMATDD